jgi:hypothetical protein
VSSASTINERNEFSFTNFTDERLVTGALASGVKALRSVVNCLSELNFKRTVAFALIAMQRPTAKGKFKVINKMRTLGAAQISAYLVLNAEVMLTAPFFAFFNLFQPFLAFFHRNLKPIQNLNQKTNPKQTLQKQEGEYYLQVKP